MMASTQITLFVDCQALDRQRRPQLSGRLLHVLMLAPLCTLWAPIKRSTLGAAAGLDGNARERLPNMSVTTHQPYVLYTLRHTIPKSYTPYALRAPTFVSAAEWRWRTSAV